MKPFKYAVATTEQDACRLLGENALALSGGSGLLNLMKEHVVEPDVVVDLKGISSMDTITGVGDGAASQVRIGANVTLSELLDSRELAAAYPALHQAVEHIATPQIRNRSTIGGNLCGRPACWYFAHGGLDCAKKGGQGCPAKEGENEFHAIFDNSGPCVMVHPSSAAPALLALGAKVGIAGPDGAAREIALETFFTSPSRDVRRENVLAPNEILTHVTLGPAQGHSATYDVRQKAAHDWPVSVASVALEMVFGVCRSARVFLGAVAPTPRRAAGAEAALAGQRITAEVAERAAGAAVEGAQALAQNGYKIAATRAAVKRAILVAGTGKWS